MEFILLHLKPSHQLWTAGESGLSCCEHFSMVIWKVGSNCNVSISWNAHVLLKFRNWGPKLFTWSMQEWASWLSTFLRTYWISSVPFETIPSVQSRRWTDLYHLFWNFCVLVLEINVSCNATISCNAKVQINHRSWGSKLWTWFLQEWAPWLLRSAQPGCWKRHWLLLRLWSGMPSPWWIWVGKKCGNTGMRPGSSMCAELMQALCSFLTRWVTYITEGR